MNVMPAPATSHDHWIAALHQHIIREGHADVPAGHIETVDGDPLKLGGWVNTRRYRRGQNPTLDARLANLPGWRWSNEPANRNGHPLKTWFAALDQHVAREGHAAVRQDHVEIVNGEALALGSWVSGRRYRRGERPLVDQALEARPGWLWDASALAYARRPTPNGSAAWLRALDQYVAREGHAVPPVSAVETIDGVEMEVGRWAIRRRTAKGVNPTLDRELEARPGWLWDARDLRGKGHTLADWLGALNQYVEREGHASPPRLWVEPYNGSEVKLGKWVNTRRERRGANPAVDAAVEAVPGWTWTPQRGGNPRPLDDFAIKLAALDQYVARVGNSIVPTGAVEVVDGHTVALGEWVSSRREQRGTNPALDAELEARAGWSWKPAQFAYATRPLEQFERFLRAVDQFVARTGHATITVQDGIEIVDGEPVHVGRWVGDRRRSRRNNHELTEVLESKPGWSWVTPHASWLPAWADHALRPYALMLAALDQYIARAGHACPPTDAVEETGGVDRTLGVWVADRRARRGENVALDEALEARPGWTWPPAQRKV